MSENTAAVKADTTTVGSNIEILKGDHGNVNRCTVSPSTEQRKDANSSDKSEATSNSADNLSNVNDSSTTKSVTTKSEQLKMSDSVPPSVSSPGETVAKPETTVHDLLLNPPVSHKGMSITMLFQ